MTKPNEDDQKSASETDLQISLTHVKQSFLLSARLIYQYLVAALNRVLRRSRDQWAATREQRSTFAEQLKIQRQQLGTKLSQWRLLRRQPLILEPAGPSGNRLSIAPARRTSRYRSAGRVAIAICAGLVVLVVGLVFYSIATLPISGGLQIEGSQSALTFESSQGEVFATRGMYKGDRLTATDLPANLAQAIVSIEDRRFYQHWGVDLRGILRAGWRNSQAGGTREGGSTITQQLARLMFLSQVLPSGVR